MIKQLSTKLKNKEAILKIVSFAFIFFITKDILNTFINSSDPLFLSNFSNYSIKIFQNSIFIFILFTIFLPFRFYYFGFALLIGNYEQKYNIFANYIHNFLLSNNFYGIFSNNPTDISQEYPRIIFFCIILLIYFGLFLKPGWKNFKRIFLFLSASGILITSIIFHSIILYEIDHFKKEQENTILRVVNYSNDFQEISKSCQILKLKCWSTNKEDHEELIKTNNIPEYIKNNVSYFSSQIKTNDNFFFYGIAQDHLAPNRLLGQTPFALISLDGSVFLFADFNNYKQLFIVNQNIFAFLSLCSHIVWFFGALFLIYFHEKRIKKKQQILP